MKFIVQSALVGVAAAQLLQGAAFQRGFLNALPYSAAASAYQPYRIRAAPVNVARAAPIQYAPQPAPAAVEPNPMWYMGYPGLAGIGPLNPYIYSDAYSTLLDNANNKLEDYTGDDAFERQQLELTVAQRQSQSNAFTFPLYGIDKKVSGLEAVKWRTALHTKNQNKIDKLVRDGASAADVSAAQTTAEISSLRLAGDTLRFMGKGGTKMGKLPWLQSHILNLKAAQERKAAAIAGGDAKKIAGAIAGENSARGFRDSALLGFMGKGDLARMSWVMNANNDASSHLGFESPP